MRQTKANVVKLLEAMSANARAVAADVQPSNPELALRLRMTASGYQDAIWLLTEPDYFNKIAEIHFPSGNE